MWIPKLISEIQWQNCVDIKNIKQNKTKTNLLRLS